jgi:tetratricopeptide (TPR) repeat protein
MRFADAQRAFEEVVAATAPGGVVNPSLHSAALLDLTVVFVEVGVPATAIEYFERVEATRGLYWARTIAQSYADRGKPTQARIVYRELRTHETDPAHVCKASMGALRASLELGKRGEIAVDLAAFVPLARKADGTCKLIADELLGQVAIAWHREMLDRLGDAREVIEVWRSALAMSTEPPRREAMLRNLAYAMWSHAAARRGDRPADWIAAAEALENAAERDAAVDAYDNALRVARDPGRSLAPVVLAQIKGGLTRLGTPRAKTMLGSLR